MSNRVADESRATSVLADGKFIAISVMLFGAGIAMVQGRARAMPT